MKTISKEKPGRKNPPASQQAPDFALDGLGDLAGLLNERVEGSALLELALERIDEDPDQPRSETNPGFSAESIAEIGGTIKRRGVKSPISVRENPQAPGRYLINHGARRFRGAQWAGKKTIPAFIDNHHDYADQVVENLQRNELTPREIADYIGRELARGKRKLDIAKEIGKSASFVTQHLALLNLPEPIALAFHRGRVNDVTVINELVSAYRKNPGAVDKWLSGTGRELTRRSVRVLRERLDDPGRDPGRNAGSLVEEGETGKPAEADDAEKRKDPEKFERTIVQVRHEERLACLLLNRRPSVDGRAWIRYEDDGREREVDLGSVNLVALVEES
jgi:ParB family chromosome partitioning protein